MEANYNSIIHVTESNFGVQIEDIECLGFKLSMNTFAITADKGDLKDVKRVFVNLIFKGRYR